MTERRLIERLTKGFKCLGLYNASSHLCEECPKRTKCRRVKKRVKKKCS